MLGEDGVPRRPARVPEGARVRQRHLARSDRDPRRAHAEDLAAWSRRGSRSRAGRRSTTMLEAEATARSRGSRFRQRDPLEPRSRLAAAAARRRSACARRRSRRSPSTLTAPRRRRRQQARRAAGAALRAAERRRLGYGDFVLDERRCDYLLDARCRTSPIALTRGSAWVTLWDTLLDGQVQRRRVPRPALRALPRETDEQMTSRVLGYAREHVLAVPRSAAADDRARPRSKRCCAPGSTRRGTQSQKAAWFGTLRNVALTPGTVAWLRAGVGEDGDGAGPAARRADEIALALELAVREVRGWNDDPARRSSSAREPRSQGPFRVRDAGALGRSRPSASSGSSARATSTTAAASRGCSRASTT